MTLRPIVNRCVLGFCSGGVLHDSANEETTSRVIRRADRRDLSAICFRSLRWTARSLVKIGPTHRIGVFGVYFDVLLRENVKVAFLIPPTPPLVLICSSQWFIL